MGMICGLEAAGFCRATALHVCVQAGVSPTVPSKRKDVEGCVHQYCQSSPWLECQASLFGYTYAEPTDGVECKW
jgi:hypothetical protein